MSTGEDQERVHFYQRVAAGEYWWVPVSTRKSVESRLVTVDEYRSPRLAF